MRRGPKPDFTRKDAQDDLYYEMKFESDKERWVLLKEGSDHVLRAADRKTDLLQAAQERAESKHAHLKIYHADGSLEVETDYTKDSPHFRYPSK
ncbi:hypothetical protein MJA45_06880 [Paenibacillus aurantius]|uniref:DUF2188 domain-containing protein n=1 Tax=Paenibacillus aurantius TaxID=2918900 RepID=A0AA96LGA8_9BACL|nr:hypothetical protein [Paenibacillus aurantius]WNQ12750.1 hypothetical protein MJA45_06880 [Paenibacillus aurantius]